MPRKLPCLLNAALCVLLCLSSAWALSGKGHAALWNEVFGVADKQSEEAIQPLWDAAQEVIDKWQNEAKTPTEYKKIRNKFKWFSWGGYGHRLLFHWGFNADPKKHPPLRKQVEKCLKAHVENHMKDATAAEADAWKREQADAFFRYLTREMQAPRNKKLINAVVEVTGVPTARGYANALATLLYDVHLLGDYQTTATSALPRIDTIEHDLTENGFRRLLTGGDKTERLQKIESELQAAVRVGRGRIDSKRAELLVETTKRLLPPLLNERFKNTLAEHGITVTEPEM